MTDSIISFNRLMERVAAELDALGGSGSRIEAMVGELVACSKDSAPCELQELDLLVQSINDLAAFAKALSVSASETCIDTAPGLATLKLHRLRRRLSGTAEDAPAGIEDDIFF